MKRLISVMMVFVMLLSQAATAFAASETNTDPVQQALPEEAFADVYGDGGAYQVASIQPTETGNGFAVAYITGTDTVLEVIAVAEDTGDVLVYAAQPVPAGSGIVVVEADLSAFPQYYQVDAALAAGGEIFTYHEHTRAYQEFMTTGADDAAFAGQVVLDYGCGFDGTQNFAVVSEDVKVLYVDTMDDVEVIGEEENAALFTLMEGSDSDAYLFRDNLGDEVLADLESGDKLLILPMDDVNEARTLVVGDVEENVNLFGDGSEDTVTVTPAEAEPEMEEFFDFVRIHVEVEADTDDLDTTGADPDLVVEELEPSAELMGSIKGSLSAKKSYTLKKSYSSIVNNGGEAMMAKLTIKDTFTLKATVELKIDYSWMTLKSVTASAKLTADNKFVIDANAKYSHSGQVYVGTIPVGTVSGVTFKIPVYLTHYVGVEGAFNFTATQSATSKVTATYKSGRYSCTTTKSATCGKDLQTSAKATVRLGVKGTVEAKLSIVSLAAGVTGEVGIQVSGKMKNNAFSGDLSVYVQPGFSIKWFDKKLVSKTWDRSTSRLASIYFSKAVYYTMDELAALTDEEILANIALYAEEGVAVSIDSAQDLQDLAAYVNASRPTAGLDFLVNTQSSTWDLSGMTWYPIGTESAPFQGTFDGRGILLTGLTVSDVASNAGLFGALDAAVVHDVTLSSVSVQGGSNVGALAGSAKNGSLIYDVSVSGSVEGTGGEIGGIVGHLYMSSLLNSCSTAAVSGLGDVGGLVGVFTYGPTVGQIANCYSAGQITAAYEHGGVCGTVYAEEEDDALASDTARYTAAGITYCYYLASGELTAAGSSTETPLQAWAVSEEQAMGTVSDAVIADDGFAAVNTLVDALNGWYAQYGAYVLEDETSGAVPEANISDYYNHWYKDADEVCFPYFEERARTYPLTVHYVFEDGSEAFPSTTIYLALGQHFDVDPQHLDGYYTNVDDTDGYTGYMNPDPTQPTYDWADNELEEFYGIEYRIVYSPETSYAGSGSDLSADAPAASGSIYKIANEADLMGLAAYVNAGGSTQGVTFEQMGDIQLTGAQQASIGTAASPFQGIYNGSYSTISGLNAPLFAVTDGAEIRALNLAGEITVSGETAGALISQAKNTAIRECVAAVSISVTGGSAGGLVGTAENCTIDSCEIRGSVNGSGAAAGVAAAMTGGKLVNCQVSASIQGGSNVGGLVGTAADAVIENSFVTGSVSGSANVGGLAGAISGGEIANCYCSGAVTGSESTGAAFGSVANGTAVESIHYLEGSFTQAVGSGSAENIAAFAAADTQALQDTLNAWVTATTSAAYLTWTADLVNEDSAELSAQADSFPVFGAPYESWLMELSISGGVVSFVFNPALTGGDAVYLAVYSQAGQMLSIHQITEGQTSFQVSDSAAYARCFALDADAEPQSAAVRTPA